MPLTILLITEPVEEARLSKSLRGPYRLRLRGDLDEEQAPADRLLAEQPDVLIFGMGQGGLSAEASLYVEAAREFLPACTIYLLSARAQAESARRYRPDALLLRPVKLTELLTALEALATGRVEAPAAPRRRPTSSQLLRVDEMLLDPADFLSQGPAVTRSPSGPAAPRPPSGPSAAQVAPPPEPLDRPAPPQREGRTSTASGQFQQIVVPPEPLPGGTQAPAEEKVAVDPSIYEDALSDIDVETLGAEELAQEPPAALAPTTGAPRPPSSPPPPPVPVDAGRRRTDPPQSPPPVPKDATTRRPSLPPVLPAPSGASEGDLRHTDPPTLIGWLCTSGYGGCLELSQEGPGSNETSKRQLYFDGGELVAAGSTLAVDSLPELLYHEGRLSREQLKRARPLLGSAAQELSNRRLAQLLADEQLLPKGEIGALLRRHVIEIFYRSFAWDKGRYRLVPRAAPPEDRVRLKETPRLLLLEGLRRKASLDTLLLRVGPESTVLVPLSSGGLLLKDAGVTAFEQRALPLFDGRHSLQQISRQSGLAEHATYVLAYALMCLGGLRRAEPAGVVVTAPTPALAQQAPRHSAPPLPPPAPVDDRAQRTAAAKERLRKKHADTSAADYFTVLDLSELASGEDVKRAFAALRAEFSDDLLPPECRAEFGAELGEIREVMDEAYAVLSNDEMRAAYRAELLPLPEEAAAKD